MVSKLLSTYCNVSGVMPNTTPSWFQKEHSSEHVNDKHQQSRSAGDTAIFQYTLDEIRSEGTMVYRVLDFFWEFGRCHLHP